MLLAGSDIDVQAVLDSPPNGPEGALELIEPADLSTRIVASVGEDLETCVLDFGGWQTADSSEGVIRLAVEGEAEIDAVDTAALENVEGLTPAEPTVDGGTVEVGFTYDTGGRPVTSPIRDLLVQFGFPQIYDCG